MKSVSTTNSLMAIVKAKLVMFIHETAVLPRKVHAAVAMLAMLISSHAMAAGVTGFFAGWKSALTTLMDLFLLAGMVIGVAAVLYGLLNMIKKGMGRGDDIEWGKIMWPIIGGSLSTILLYVVQAVVEEGGATRGDMGRSQ